MLGICGFGCDAQPILLTPAMPYGLAHLLRRLKQATLPDKQRAKEQSQSCRCAAFRAIVCTGNPLPCRLAVEPGEGFEKFDTAYRQAEDNSHHEIPRKMQGRRQP